MSVGRCLLLSATSVSLLAGSAWAASQPAFPKLDMRGTCGSGGVAQRDRNSCLSDENKARGQLRRKWSSIPAEIRKTCTEEVTVGGAPSYVELLTCAELAETAASMKDPLGDQPSQRRRGARQ